MSRPNKTYPPKRLRTEAWLLLGISSIPGELVLQGGQVEFTAFNTGSAWPWQLRKLERRMAAPGIAATIDQGTRTSVFKWPVGELKAWCPWYYFGGGIKLRYGPLLLRFSFGRPANTTIRTHQLGSAFALREAWKNLSEIGAMRSRGALWQAALCPHSSGKRDDA